MRFPIDFPQRKIRQCADVPFPIRRVRFQNADDAAKNHEIMDADDKLRRFSLHPQRSKIHFFAAVREAARNNPYREINYCKRWAAKSLTAIGEEVDFEFLRVRARKLLRQNNQKYPFPIYEEYCSNQSEIYLSVYEFPVRQTVGQAVARWSNRVCVPDTR